ncbi:hypothetical protein ACJMK2_004335 [Sinanodonta woodiana]|uniref:Peptidase M12B domain-containing protein n=1 Tax=Sinanodonta woodiana TaxID=1069815 RepID=A0ABD3Y2N3_SINWO
MSFIRGVCDLGLRTSIIQAGHYQRTVQAATHELGHTLGADHDGDGDAVACKSEDLFIMTKHTGHINKERPYIKNLWIFSSCSVESFKKTLKTKECVKHPSLRLNTDEWTMKRQPGEVFTPQEQCVIIYGPGSKFYGVCTLCFLTCICENVPTNTSYVSLYNELFRDLFESKVH